MSTQRIFSILHSGQLMWLFWWLMPISHSVIIQIDGWDKAYIQWGKKVFSQSPIVQVLPLKKMREACNFHHRYTSTMRDKIRKKKSRKSHCRIFKEFICKLWWKISIWSISKFHLNTLLYTLCWQWQWSNVFCKSSQGFHTLLLVFWPIPPCRSPLE